jgi:hypothetical protein
MRFLAFALLLACTGDPEPAAIAAWDPVDETFAGCAGSCGARVEHAPRAVMQPGASVGDETYCPVSGAFFRVEVSHPHRDADGRRFYFCCDGCASYFDAHTHEVLAARGIED